MEVSEDAGPERVASDVAGVEVPDVLDGSGEAHVEGDLGGAGVVAFEAAELALVGFAAVAAEEDGGDLEGEGWLGGSREGGGREVDDSVASLSESRGCEVDGAANGRGGRNDTIG